MKKAKWLLAILILLNITVFIYLYHPFDRMAGENTTVVIADKDSQNEVNASWLSIAPPVFEASEALNNDTPAITASDEVITSTPIEEASTVATTEDADRKWCLPSIAVNEENYTALKPILAKIKHQVKKSEKKQETVIKGTNKILYNIHLPAEADSTSQISALSDAGIKATLSGKKISLGSPDDAISALALKQKAIDAGFSQTTITEQNIPVPERKEEKIITTYQIQFPQMDEKVAQKAVANLKIKVNITAKTCEKPVTD